MIYPCPYLNPPAFHYVFVSSVQLRRGVIEWLWWAPGIQPGSTHHRYTICLLGMIWSVFSSVLLAKTDCVGFRLYSVSQLNPVNHSLFQTISASLSGTCFSSCLSSSFCFEVPVACCLLILFTKHFCCFLWDQEKFKTKKFQIFILTVSGMQFYSQSLSNRAKDKGNDLI